MGFVTLDVHIHDGYFDAGNDEKIPSRLTQPLAMGHEIYGELVEVGEEVEGVKVEINMLYIHGLVVVNAMNAKETWNILRPLYCTNLGINVNGGHAEYVLVKDARYLFDAGDTPEELAGSYACRGLTAYSALKKAKLKPNQNNIVIISAGGLGLFSFKDCKSCI